MNTFITFRVIFISTIFTLAIAPAGYWLARKLGWTDNPNAAPHKLHKAPMPIAGGPVLFVTLIAVCLLLGAFWLPEVRPILLASVVIFIFGLWDDLKDISPAWKLLGQLLATVLLIILGVQVRLFTQEWLNYALTIFWVVGVTNAYNFVDSTDGLAVGLAVLASAFFLLVTIDSGQGELSILSTILLGACLGAFFYNATPAIFFLGDSGAQFLGFILAAIAIAYNPIGFSRLASWYVPILLVAVPIFDTTLVVFSRLRRKSPIYKASLDHTYHRMVQHGMSSNRAVLTMHLTALLLGCLSFIALPMPPLVSNLIFGTVLIGGGIAILYLDYHYEV